MATAIKKLFLTIFISGLLFFPGLTSVASTDMGSATGLKSAANTSGLSKKFSGAQDVQKVIGRVLGAVLGFVGIIFFVLILYAGIKWMTAMGAAEQADKAKGMMEHAAIGLAIVLAAYALTAFVFGSLIGG